MVTRFVDRLLGQVGHRDKRLPERKLRIQFELPKTHNDKQRAPELNVRELQKELRQHKDMPLNQLELAIDQLHRLSKYQCGVRKRAAMLEMVGNELAPLICDTYDQYREEAGVPESEARRRNMDKLIELIRLLCLGQQQLFNEIYLMGDFGYRQYRERLNLSGIRILELLYVEQRVCAQRYQLFGPQRWRDINQVFFVLWLYERVDEPHVMQINLPGALRKAATTKNNQRQRLSAKQLFISIQLFGLADCYTWPNEFVQVLDNYIKLFEPQINITPDGGTELKPGHLLTFYNWERPPLYRRTGSRGSGCLIDITAMKRQIIEDSAILNSLDAEAALLKISPPLSVLENGQRLTFMEMLQYKLQPHQRRDNREVIEAYRDFTIISGFMNCYKKLSAKPEKVDQKAKNVLELSLDEMLAGRSSALADDSRDVKHGEWFVVNDSAGGVLVRTKETKYLVSMEVGDLALFKQVNDPSGPLQLGFISRLMRPGQGEINVTLQKFSDRVECVALQTPQMHKSGQAVPGFLLRSMRGGWQLLIPAKYSSSLARGSLFVRQGERLFSIEITGVAHRHHDFSILDISSNT